MIQTDNRAADTKADHKPEHRPKRILLFGDSNIWGYNPLDGSQQPNRASVRIAQMRSEWTLAADGQNGRFLFCRDPFCDTDGSKQIKRVLERLPDQDVIVIALGANDARRSINQSIDAWKASLERFLSALEQAIFECCPKKRPQVLLVGPPLIAQSAMTSMDTRIFYGQSGQTILQAAQPAIEKAAAARGMHALRADRIGLYGGNTDGIHLDRIGHEKLAEGIVDAVDKLIGDDSAGLQG